MNITQREIEAGLRPAIHPNPSTKLDAKTLSLRIKWVNNLRSVVSRRMPKNKVGSPIISDVDLLLADSSEREEALEMTLKNKKQ